MTDRSEMKMSGEQAIEVLRQQQADAYKLEEHILTKRLGEKPTKDQVLAAVLEHALKSQDRYWAEFRIAPLTRARLGDYSELADLVRKGVILNEEERDLAADFMLRKVPKLRGAPTKHELRLAISKVYFWRFEVDGIFHESVVTECRDRFRMVRSSIHKHLKDGRSCLITQDTIVHYRNLVNLGREDILFKYKELDLLSE